MQHVELMLRFIGEHALEDISTDDVGRAAGLHPNYAMNVFKRGVGMTINQAIIRHRLDTAQSLLISTDMQVTEVAYDSGFSSLSAFYEAFHKRFGEKPVQYRKRMRQGHGTESTEEYGPQTGARRPAERNATSWSSISSFEKEARCPSVRSLIRPRSLSMKRYAHQEGHSDPDDILGDVRKDLRQKTDIALQRRIIDFTAQPKGIFLRFRVKTGLHGHEGSTIRTEYFMSHCGFR